MWDESLGTYKVWPGEGSHGDFGPRGWKQRALAAYVESQIGYCETEHVSTQTHMPHPNPSLQESSPESSNMHVA